MKSVQSSCLLLGEVLETSDWEAEKSNCQALVTRENCQDPVRASSSVDKHVTVQIVYIFVFAGLQGG